VAGDPGADRPEIGGIGLLRCPAEDVSSADDSDVDESRPDDQGPELVCEEAASDTPSPQLNVGFR
jgi:hypothetical protein